MREEGEELEVKKYSVLSRVEKKVFKFSLHLSSLSSLGKALEKASSYRLQQRDLQMEIALLRIRICGYA